MTLLITTFAYRINQIRAKSIQLLLDSWTELTWSYECQSVLQR